jgi:hypothetical protein
MSKIGPRLRILGWGLNLTLFLVRPVVPSTKCHPVVVQSRASPGLKKPRNVILVVLPSILSILFTKSDIFSRTIANMTRTWFIDTLSDLPI